MDSVIAALFLAFVVILIVGFIARMTGSMWSGLIALAILLPLAYYLVFPNFRSMVGYSTHWPISVDNNVSTFSVGQFRRTKIGVSGGQGNLTVEASPNDWNGLRIASDGTISGTPVGAGSAEVWITVHDTVGDYVRDVPLTLVVMDPSKVAATAAPAAPAAAPAIPGLTPAQQAALASCSGRPLTISWEQQTGSVVFHNGTAVEQACAMSIFKAAGLVRMP